MSSRRNSKTNEEDCEIVETSQGCAVKNNPSSYFKADVHITNNKRSVSSNAIPDNCVKSFSTKLEKTKEQIKSCGNKRKFVVSVNTRGPIHQKEISVTSRFSTSQKVDSSTQSDRKLVGEEESIYNESNKWIRPPLVGQAANSKDLSFPSMPAVHSSSDSEVEQPSPSVPISSQQASSYFSHIEPVKTGKHEIDSNNSDKYEAISHDRGPSPGSASSLTSRPLEWDSGADVGYDNAFASAGVRLSTLEKMALIKGSASIFTRSDPEGTTEHTLKISIPKNRIGLPTAESTPVNAGGVRGSEKNIDKNKLHLFPEVIVKKICSGSVSSSPDFSKEKVQTYDGKQSDESISKKLSTSLENIVHCSREDLLPFTFPRSHSQVNVSAENELKSSIQQVVEALKSHSSSSISTVVNKRNIPEKRSIHVQTQSRSAANSDGDFSVKSGDEVSRKHSPEGTGGECNTLESGPLSGEARVNSFEYLPGHVYENAVANGNQPESLLSPEEEESWKDNGHPSLKKDVERGVNLLVEFFRTSTTQDPELKRQLVQQVVDKIINENYSDDDKIIPNIKSSNFLESEMFEARGQISGESSVEKSEKSDNSKVKADKCVGTGVSTTLSGCSGSSEWHSVSESNKGSRSNQGRKSHEHRRPINENSDYPKTSDESSRLDEEIKNQNKGKPAIDEAKMIDYLNKERKSQLYWIKSEINHLSNLKMLLEKHEVLKKNLASLKKGRMKLEQPLKTCSEKMSYRKSQRLKDGLSKIQSAPLQGQIKSPPKLSSASSTATSNVSLEKDNGWTSHHYETECEGLKGSEDVENIQPQNKKYSKTGRSASETKPCKPTAYALNFTAKSAPHLRDSDKIKREDDILLSVGELKTAIDKIVEKHRQPSPQLLFPQPTLKDYLECGRPDYITRAESRRQILTELVELRQARQASKTQIIAGGADVPPPPLASKRLFDQKNLRKQTETKYRQLSEVKNKKAELKRKEEYRTNRLMAEIFTRKLQKKTLKGQVNLSNSVCVISPT